MYVYTPDDLPRLINRFLNEEYYADRYRDDNQAILSLLTVIIRKGVMKCMTYRKNRKKYRVLEMPVSTWKSKENEEDNSLKYCADTLLATGLFPSEIASDRIN